MDPGNFATNIQGGAQFGFMLLWVIVASNLLAMLLQTMSAKLGIASGRNLAETCRENFRRPVVLVMWALMEIVAMATDLAEFLGAALGFNLLFGIPLWMAGILTALATFLILSLERFGFRPIEAIITDPGGRDRGKLYRGAGPRTAAARTRFSCTAWCPSSAARRACSSPLESSGPRSCRTRSSCTPPSRRPAW